MVPHLEIVQFASAGSVHINGVTLPKWNFEIYHLPKISGEFVHSSPDIVVHRLPRISADWVFVLLSVSLLGRTPAHLESDWPPGAVGTNHLEKPGVKVWVSGDSQSAVAWVNDQNGLHQLDGSNLVYPFEEGMLRVVGDKA